LSIKLFFLALKFFHVLRSSACFKNTLGVNSSIYFTKNGIRDCKKHKFSPHFDIKKIKPNQLLHLVIGISSGGV